MDSSCKDKGGVLVRTDLFSFQDCISYGVFLEFRQKVNISNVLHIPSIFRED